MRASRCCGGLTAAVIALVAMLAVRPDLILPHKIHAAISMKGWDGFSTLIAANIAQRTKGQRTTKSREAWYRLLESLKDIDVKFLAPTSDVVTAEEIAQGHEFTLHLLSIGLEAYVINADFTRPRFKNLFNPDHKWLVDQPDAVYLTATIATGYDYVIEGTRKGEVYFSYTVYEHPRGGGWAQNVTSECGYPRSSLSGLDITPDAAGRYRVLVSATPPLPGSLALNEQWLRIPAHRDPGEVSVLARHYFEGETSVQTYGGRARADVAAEIRVVEPTPAPDDTAGGVARSKFPPIPTDENVAQRIDFLSNFLLDHTVINAPGGEMSKRPEHRIPDWYSVVPNVIGKPGLFIGASSGAGAPDVNYAAGPWKLAPHEALVIEGIFPSAEECVFANVLLINKFLQSLDYQHGRSTSFNRRQIKGLGDDGAYKIVLAHASPGPGYNWLDTEGRETGIVFYRFMLNTAELAQTKTTVVTLADLPG